MQGREAICFELVEIDARTQRFIAVFSVGRAALLAKTNRETWRSPQTFGSLTIGADVRKAVPVNRVSNRHKAGPHMTGQSLKVKVF